MKILTPTAEGLSEAADAIWEGEIVAYPTETSYGLAVDPFNEEAVSKLFELKGRREDHPVLLIIDSEQDLEDIAGEIDEQAAAFIDAFWPGPLSILLPKSDDLPALITAGSDRVCVRCPDNDIARHLCRVYGGPLTSTSANRTGAAPARSVTELDLPGLAVAIDGGTLPDGLPSTVFDPATRQILRPGRISEEALQQAYEKFLRQ